MKHACGHDAVWLGDSMHSETKPCPECAVRDWKAMQALRGGMAVLTPDPRGGAWIAVSYHGKRSALCQDPAEAILEVL